MCPRACRSSDASPCGAAEPRRSHRLSRTKTATKAATARASHLPLVVRVWREASVLSVSLDMRGTLDACRLFGHPRPVRIGTVPLLGALGVPHAFLAAPLDAAAPEDVCRAAIAQVVGAPSRTVCLANQVHGTACVRAARIPMEADALWSDDARELCAVRTADCGPVLLASSRGDWVCAVHAGWRGLVGGVLTSAVQAYPGDPSELVAAIGPCIGSGTDHFEVGVDVLAAFERAGLAEAMRRRDSHKAYIDLAEGCGLALQQLGVTHIDAAPPCSYASADCFSHRRDVTHGGRHAAGRMASVVGVVTQKRQSVTAVLREVFAMFRAFSETLET